MSGSGLPAPAELFVDWLRTLQQRIARTLWFRQEADAQQMASVVASRGGDTIYLLDTHAEEIVLEACADLAHLAGPFILVMEGLPDGHQFFPARATPADAAFVVIIDPVDGTRELMYGLRSAWALGGIAPAAARWRRGADAPIATLADIVVAVQTELPVRRNNLALADQLWAVRGQGMVAQRMNLDDGSVQPLTLQPATQATIAHGFAIFCKPFLEGKTWLAACEEDCFARHLTAAGTPNAPVFDDQYISSGGQLYELLRGHYRFVADLRPLAGSGLCAHPYDLCTILIAQEAGVLVTGPDGAPLAAPLDVTTAVAWVAYANAALRAALEPHLQETLHRALSIGEIPLRLNPGSPHPANAG
jgi:hypothetical protein